MEHPDYLPLGSVCTVKGSDKGLMVIERGVLVHERPEAEELTFYDYGACLYPEGLVGDQVIFFNHDAVQKVLWEGFRTDEDGRFVAGIAESTRGLDIRRGDPAPLAFDDGEEDKRV